MNKMSIEDQMNANGGGLWVGSCIKCSYSYQSYNKQTVVDKMVAHCFAYGGPAAGHRYELNEY